MAVYDDTWHVVGAEGPHPGARRGDREIGAARDEPPTAPRTGKQKSGRGAEEYAELKRRVKARGLLDEQPRYYAARILLNLVLLAVSIVILFAVDNFVWQLFNAAFLAFIFTQVSGISHDSGHRQVCATSRQNDAVVLLHAGLLLGVSASWWMDKHNQHHATPNVLDMDPDIDFPIVAFSEEQAVTKRGFQRFMVKYQAYFYPLLVPLVPIGMRVDSFRVLFGGKSRYPRVEALLIGVHFALYFGMLIAALGLWQALVFAAVHHFFIGLYMASVFAPNHKGMPILPKGHELDFMRLQIVTARNVRAHPVTDFLYVGLNYQIEHHLFPSMPRNKLRECQQIVRAFCEEHEIPYYETSFLQSYKELLLHLHRVSAPLRADAAQ